MGTTGLSLTLANSIIGVGILAMPFCFQQCGVLLATLILLLMGLVSRLCCYFILKSALLARRSNFEFLAFQVFGPAGKFAVEVGIIGFLMGTCIAYFVVVGDLGPQIISKMFHINQSDILRTSIMVIVSLVCVLPLGLLRNVDSLSNVSAATIGFYFCLVIKVVIEAAGQMFSGDWHTRLELWKPSGVLQCVPIFSMALFCQTQLFEVFESMPTLSLEKMNVVTKNAINICTSVYFTLGVFGYIAFGSQTISGNVLMSLSPTMTSDVIKLGFVMSVAFSFPLIIFPCRASIYSLLFKKVHAVHHDHIVNHSIPQTTFRCITVCIIVVALFVSLLIPNIELVLGLVGSTIGVLICVTFPAACFVNVTFKNTNERILAKGVIILGLVIMVLGTYANLQAADNIERYDDRYITQERIDKMVEDFFEKMDKSGGALLKPLDPNENVIKKIEIDDNKIIKDSEVQPPNPVPPESYSLEDKRAKNDNKEKNNVAMKEILAVEKAQIDKVIEKNIMKDTVAAVKPKPDQPIKTPEKLVKDDSKIKDEAQRLNKELKIQANNEKINMIKQQQLIETMKQHGEEQKELIKEQKEILNEIQKTKNDLSNNEIDSNEAKKIAVESIQKIANMAIQSLGGVTDLPPVQSSFEKKSEPLEKLANDAVQQIAKKAAETIEAMKEQQEKVNEAPKQPAVLPPGPAEPILQRINSNSLPAAQPVPIIKNEPKPALTILNAVPAANPPGVKNPPQIPQQVIPVQNQNAQPNAKQQQQIIQNGENAQSILNAVSVNNEIKPPVINQKAENVPNNINNPVVEKLPVANIPIANQLAQNVIKDKVVKAHSHSPDEPQSYKQGEDSQKKDIANKSYNLNVPIPVAMNGNSQPVKSAENVIAPIPINNNEKVSNNIVNNGAHDPLAKSRSKREADKYCEKKITDKEIINIKQSEEILPKVDLSDVSLINKIPLDPNVVHHIRSLKSVKDTHKKDKVFL